MKARVWHIVDYGLLYKAVNKAGADELEMVQYTQRHINAPYNNPAAQRCINRFNGLKQALKLPQFLVVRYVYEELLDQSQNHRGDLKYLRGYIVDECLGSPDNKRIAAMVGMGVKETAAILRQLEKVGLIERVDLPDDACWETVESGPLEEEKNGKKQRKKTAAKTKKARKTTVKKRCKTADGKGLGSVGSELELDAKHLLENKKKKKNKETEVEREVEVPRPSASAEEELKKYRPSASVEKECRTESGSTAAAGLNGTGDRWDGNAEKQAEHDGTAKEQEIVQVQADPPDPPTTTPPIAEMPNVPTQTDGLGEGYADDRLRRTNADILRVRDVERFADEIYFAIKDPWDKHSAEGARQVGNYEAYWRLVLVVGFGLATLRELWDANMAEARKQGKRRQKLAANDNSPNRVWRSNANNRLDNAKQEFYSQPKKEAKTA